MTEHETLTLRVKLQRFVSELTPEELAYLRSSPPEAGPGDLPPALEAKAERAVQGLTPEEDAQLQHLVQEAVAGGAADTQGHMRTLYEGDQGWKGRPGTDPTLNRPGGSNLSGRGARFVQNLKFVFGGIGEEVGNHVNLPFF
jgi:hypothetical protein